MQESPVDFLESQPDKALLGEGMVNLPAAEQRRWRTTEMRTRARLIAIGSTLTGVTLIGGIVLLVLGAIGALSHGIRGSDVVITVLGVAALATHWGWVHVAEATADSIEGRRNREELALRMTWLETIKPYTRYSVSTEVLADGSIRIVRSRHRPFLAAAGTFAFAREQQVEEVYSSEGSGADIAERAETLRRQAALDTERERERFEVAADAYETVLLEGNDEQQRLAARRAVALALSEQINSNLRQPPLAE